MDLSDYDHTMRMRKFTLARRVQERDYTLYVLIFCIGVLVSTVIIWGGFLYVGL